MVRVPTYERGREIRATETTSIRADSDMFGAMQARAQAKLGAQIANVFSQLGSALGAQQAQDDKMTAGIEMSKFEAELQKEAFRMMQETPPEEMSRIHEKFMPQFDQAAAATMQRIPSGAQKAAGAGMMKLRSRYDVYLANEALKRGFDYEGLRLNEQATNEAAVLRDHPEGMDDSVRRLRALGDQSALPRWKAQQVFEANYMELVKAGQQGYLNRGDMQGARDFVRKYLYIAPQLGIDTQLPGSAPLAPQSEDTPAGQPGSAPRAVLSPIDRDDVIRTVFTEARKSDAARESVADVIRNRLVSGRYGKTASQVVRSPGAFSVWQLSRSQMASIQPGHPEYEAIGRIVDRVFAGEVKDITKGATHFYSPAGMQQYLKQGLAASAEPRWAVGQKRLAAIGGHLFFAPEGRVGNNEPIGINPTASTSSSDATPGTAMVPVRNVMEFGADEPQVTPEVAGKLVATDETGQTMAGEGGAVRVAEMRPAVGRADRWNTFMKGLETQQRQAEARLRQSQAGEREVLKQKINSDMMAIQSGAPEDTSITPQIVGELLDPAYIDTWQKQRQASREFGAAMTGFDQLTPAERTQRVESLRPTTPGVDFQFRLQLYQDAIKRQNALAKEDDNAAKAEGDRILKEAYQQRRSGTVTEEWIKKIEPYATPAEMREFLNWRPKPTYPNVRDGIHDRLNPKNFPFNNMLAGPLAVAQQNALQEYDLWDRANPNTPMTEHIARADEIYRRHAFVLQGDMRMSIGIVPGMGNVRPDQVTMDHVNLAREKLAQALETGGISREQATNYSLRLQEWERALSGPLVTSDPGRGQGRSGGSYAPPSLQAPGKPASEQPLPQVPQQPAPQNNAPQRKSEPVPALPPGQSAAGLLLQGIQGLFRGQNQPQEQQLGE